MKYFCEHCGPTNMKVYPKDGTTWCKYCMEANGDMCSKHPKYTRKFKPTGNCEMCWFLWLQSKGRDYFGW